MMNLSLETERLCIRPLMIKDIDFIIQLLNTKGWIQFIGDRNIKDVKSATDYIQRILSNDKFFYNVFEIKDTNTPIGIVTFLFRENHDSPDIGFAMLPQYAKKGYAFEATKTYLEELKRNRTGKIIAITKSDNENSIQLLKKLGLLFEKTHLENDEILEMYSTILNDK
ncbi:GNAT family N-acetyltransferase [Aquirufa sp. ROCK2-A2]